MGRFLKDDEVWLAFVDQIIKPPPIEPGIVGIAAEDSKLRAPGRS